MAPKKAKQTAQRKKPRSSRASTDDKPKKQRNAQVPRPRGALDAPALAYARLLRDPCGARSVGSLFPGANGTQVQAFKCELVFPGTGGVIQFTPNAIGIQVSPQGSNGAYAYFPTLVSNSSTSGSNTYFNWAPMCGSNGGTTSTPATTVNAAIAQLQTQSGVNAWNYGGNQGVLYPPGALFLSSNASQARCVAACVRLTYIGTELNRSGQVYSFVAPADTAGDLTSLTYNLNTGPVISCDAIRGMSTACERAPTRFHERRFVPSFGDGEFQEIVPALKGMTTGTTPTVVYTDQTPYSTLSSIFVGWDNFQATNTIRAEFFATYEYRPRTNAGMPVLRPMATTSTNSVNDVLRALDKTSSDWSVTMSSAAPYVAGVAKTLAALVL